MYRPKIERDAFDSWFSENTQATLEEICKTFDIAVSTAYKKRKGYYQRHRYDPESSQLAVKIHREGYNEGYSSGFFNGIAIGILGGDVLKSSGLGVSDIIGKIAGWMMKPTPAAPAQEGV